MRDPAVEAVQRAIAATDGYGFDNLRDAMEEAAREALATVRALIEIAEEFGDELDLDDLKKLCYTSEELSSEQ